MKDGLTVMENIEVYFFTFAFHEAWMNAASHSFFGLFCFSLTASNLRCLVKVTADCHIRSRKLLLSIVEYSMEGFSYLCYCLCYSLR